MSFNFIDENASSYVDPNTGDVPPEPFEPFKSFEPLEDLRDSDGNFNETKLNQVFEFLLDEMNLKGEKRKRLLQKSLDEKYRFLTVENNTTKNICAPEYLIKKIVAYEYIQPSKREPLSKILSKISTHIKHSLISWGTRFNNAKGYLLLFSLLSKYAGSINGFVSISEENALIISNIVNIIYVSCSKKMILSNPKLIPYLIRTIHPKFNECSFYALNILFLFLNEKDESKLHKNRYLIKKEIKKVALSKIYISTYFFYSLIEFVSFICSDE